MGPTACGKTTLSLSLARRMDAEIVSVDSALVYRGLDIGTAKPGARERGEIQHHLIDVCEPWEPYSAARFCEDAARAIEDISSRGHKALLVGGTMLYFKALEEGLAELPEADVQVRAALLEEAQRVGWPAMHVQLAGVDPLAAERIHPNDPQRLQRALEVYRITGVPMSRLQADTRSRLDVMPVKFALVPDSRAWLHQRIETRFRQMRDAGFMDEVQRLRRQPGLNDRLPAIRSVGYRQAWAHLDKGAGMDSDWVDQAVAATRQLAKRQLTWLRGMQNVTRIACDTLSLDAQEQAILRVLK